MHMFLYAQYAEIATESKKALVDDAIKNMSDDTEYILVPMNCGRTVDCIKGYHFVLLALHLKKGISMLYNSMTERRTDKPSHYLQNSKEMATLIINQIRKKNMQGIDCDSLLNVNIVENCPQQGDIPDCAFFVLELIERYLKGREYICAPYETREAQKRRAYTAYLIIKDNHEEVDLLKHDKNVEEAAATIAQLSTSRELIRHPTYLEFQDFLSEITKNGLSIFDM